MIKRVLMRYCSLNRAVVVLNASQKLFLTTGRNRSCKLPWGKISSPTSRGVQMSRAETRPLYGSRSSCEKKLIQ